MSQYTNKSQQRICQLIEALSGYEEKGRTLKDLAGDLKTPPTMTFRDLKNLEEIGWVREAGGRWYMTPQAAEPAVRIQRNLDSLMDKVQRLHQDYLRGGNR